MSNIEKKSKQGTLSYVKIIFAGMVVFWLLRSDAFDLSLFKKILSPWPWFLGLLLVFIGIVINNYRWKLLLKSISQDFSQLYLLELSLLGVFYSFIAPGGVGGDVVKGYTIYRDKKVSKSRVALSILFDRGAGMLAMLVMACGAGFYYKFYEMGKNENLLNLVDVVLYALIVSVVLGVLFLKFDKIFLALFKKYFSHAFYEKILELHSDIRPLIIQLVVSVVISIFAQCFFIFMFAMLAEFLNYNVPMSAFFIFVPLGMICSALPISPAGVGVGQAAFYYLFNIYEAGAGSLGVLGFTFFQAILLIWGFIGIAISFLIRRKVNHVG